MRIKKFNESFDEEDMIEYIKDCFVEFFDDDDTQNYMQEGVQEWGDYTGKKYFKVQIFFPKFERNYNYSYIRDPKDFMGDVSEHTEMLLDVYQDLDVSMKKIELKVSTNDINFLYTYNDKHCFGYQIPASLEIKIFL